MRRRNAIGLSVLVGAAVLLLGVSFWRREPRYKGRSLSAWLEDLDLETSHSPDQAEQAVRAIGTNAFPSLVRMLCSEEPFWERAVVELEKRQAVLRLRFTPANAVRYRAVLGYGVLGVAARDNVPALIRALTSEKNSPQVRASVAAALGCIGPAAHDALPALARAAEDTNPQVHRNAVLALINIQRSADRQEPSQFWR